MRCALVLTVVAVAVSSGCRKPETADHPVDAYLAFTRLAERDPKTAFDALSKQTREQLSARSKELSAASAGAIVDDPAWIFFSRPGRVPAIEDVKVVEESAELATLEVKSASQVDRIRMVREDNKWRVDLMDRLNATDGGAGAADGGASDMQDAGVPSASIDAGAADAGAAQEKSR